MKIWRFAFMSETQNMHRIARFMLILPLLVSGCRSKGATYKGVTAMATEWPLHDTRGESDS